MADTLRCAKKQQRAKLTPWIKLPSFITKNTFQAKHVERYRPRSFSSCAVCIRLRTPCQLSHIFCTLQKRMRFRSAGSAGCLLWTAAKDSLLRRKVCYSKRLLISQLLEDAPAFPFYGIPQQPCGWSNELPAGENEPELRGGRLVLGHDIDKVAG